MRAPSGRARRVGSVGGTVGVLVIAGCGGSSSPVNGQQAQHAVVSAQAIQRAFLHIIGAHLDGVGDVEYPAPTNPVDNCHVTLILAKPREVAAHSGDPRVSVNTAGTAGAEVVGAASEQSGCMRKAAAVLNGIK